MAVLTVVLVHQRISRDDIAAVTVVTVIGLDRRIGRRRQLGMRLRRMADTEVRVFRRMTVYTAACSTYRMTRGITRQAAIRRTVYMAVLTVGLMHRADDRTGMTRRTVGGVRIRHHRCMRARRMR